MKYFKECLFIETKRTIKIFSKSLINIVLILVIVFAAMFGLSRLMGEKQVFRAIDVGVVMPEDEEEMQLIMDYISSTESGEAVCVFHYLGEEEAMEQLQQGNLQAVVLLPEDTYRSLNRGDDASVELYVAKKGGADTSVFEELMVGVMEFYQIPKTGIDATMFTAKTYEINIARNKLDDAIANMYMEQIILRGNIYNDMVASPIGEANLAQYYLVSALMILLLVLGVNFGYLYQKRNTIVEEKMRVYGVSAGQYYIIKIIIMSGVMWILSSLLYIVGCIVSRCMDSWFLQMEWYVFFVLLLLSIMIALYFHIIFELAGRGIQSSVVLFLTNIIMIIASGAIIPLAYMPQPIRTIGRYLPMNDWIRCGIHAMFQRVTVMDWCKMICMIAIGGVIGAGITCRNTLNGSRYN